MLVSDCCGARPRGNGDSDLSDIGICGDCGEHCEYVEEEEMEYDLPENYDPLRSSSSPTQEDFSNWQKLK